MFKDPAGITLAGSIDGVGDAARDRGVAGEKERDVFLVGSEMPRRGWTGELGAEHGRGRVFRRTPRRHEERAQDDEGRMTHALDLP